MATKHYSTRQTAPSAESATLDGTMTTLLSNIASWLAAADAAAPSDSDGARAHLFDWIMFRLGTTGIVPPTERAGRQPTALGARTWAAAP